MDNRSFIKHLSQKTAQDTHSTTETAEILTSIIGASLAELDTVAIPGFGSFTATKTDEHIVNAPDGTRTLMPPCISIHFKAGSRLSKDAAPAL